jgi:flagellar basal-body rod protein FlgG
VGQRFSNDDNSDVANSGYGSRESYFTADGKVAVKAAGQTEQTQIGSLQLVKFANPSGLLSIGKNMFKETQGSGTPVQGTAGQQGFGTIQQGFLEGSNVQMVEELINLIQAQRAFEANSKLITASDDILKRTNNLS